MEHHFWREISEIEFVPTFEKHNQIYNIKYPHSLHAKQLMNIDHRCSRQFVCIGRPKYTASFEKITFQFQTEIYGTKCKGKTGFVRHRCVSEQWNQKRES